MAFHSDDLYRGDQYFKNNPTWDDEGTIWKANAIDHLLKKNKLMPESVVEVGCGAGGILRRLSELNPGIQSFTGYDISPHAISLAKPHENDKIKFLHTDFLKVSDSSSDLLLVIDVVEHVDDYYGFLNKIKLKSQFTIFHIPLDLSCRNILKPHTLQVQRDNVGHIHYFSKEIFLMSLQDTGYQVIDWVYTKPASERMPVKGFKKTIKKTLRRLSFSLNKNLSAKLWGDYSILLLAK